MKKFFTLGSLLLLSSVVLSGCNTAPQVDEQVRTDVMMTSNYMKYDEQKVADALSDNKDVVLFFHAQRCSSCKKLDANLIASAEAIPANIIIAKVDYDDSTELKVMYNVTTQHTLVLLNDDMTEQKKTTRGSTLQEIIDFVGISPSIDENANMNDTIDMNNTTQDLIGNEEEGMIQREDDVSAGSR